MFFASQAVANPAEVRSCIINALENKLGLYVCRDCPGNVSALLDHVRKTQDGSVDLTEAKVLFMRPPPGPFGYAAIKGHATRPGNPDEWNFHVALEYKGYIFDLDYRDQTKLIKTQDYLKEMFRVGTSTTKDFQITPIPAVDYVREYGHLSPDGKHVDHSYYLNSRENGGRYKPRSAEKVLKDGDLGPNKGTPLTPELNVGPRLTVERGVVDWREGETYARLSVDRRAVMIVRNGNEVRDPARVEKFLVILEERAKVDPEVREAWEAYLRAGGKRAGE